MAAHRGAEAVKEFQKIISYIGVASNDPTIVVAARLQLARAWALSGDRGKAKSAYEDFLNSWKDADADCWRIGMRKRCVASPPRTLQQLR
jgi:hypothetical protein